MTEYFDESHKKRKNEQKEKRQREIESVRQLLQKNKGMFSNTGYQIYVPLGESKVVTVD